MANCSENRLFFFQIHFCSFVWNLQAGNNGYSENICFCGAFIHFLTELLVAEVDSVDCSQGRRVSSTSVMLLCFLSRLLYVFLHVAANWSREPTMTSPGNLSPAGVKCGPRQRSLLQHGWRPNNPNDLSHVQPCPLSHLLVAPVRSSCLPLAWVTLVVVPWRVLWNQRDDLKFYPLTPVWEERLWLGCTHTIGFFISFLLSFFYT